MQLGPLLDEAQRAREQRRQLTSPVWIEMTTVSPAYVA
jgi:hypothetical protein